MGGRATPAQLAAFLVALRAKGETVGEIVGFRDAVLANAQPLPVDPMALDIVGTGGDRFGTVNVSTMASVVAAAAGRARRQARQQGRELSASGSSDVLAALGIDLTIAPERVAAVLDEVGITFAFAALFHPGFKHAGPDPRGARHPDGVQLPRPAVQPGASRGVRRRRRPARQGAALRRRVPDPRRDRAGVPRRRRARRAVDHGAQPHLGGLARRGARARPRPGRPRHCPRATARRPARRRRGDATPRSRGACSAGEEGPVRDIVLLNAAAGLVVVGAGAGCRRWPSRTSGRGSASSSPARPRSWTRVRRSPKLDAWVAATRA